ncbi:hypothetical protein C1924_13690 [Stenotrophomonas sp. ESTM1D_MKCIP4_1]|nr:hypothetical protein C1924_13690 [Stenotrophomonas sp. ESTM1D_MKCIP4_1]
MPTGQRIGTCVVQRWRTNPTILAPFQAPAPKDPLPCRQGPKPQSPAISMSQLNPKVGVVSLGCPKVVPNIL